MWFGILKSKLFCFHLSCIIDSGLALVCTAIVSWSVKLCIHPGADIKNTLKNLFKIHLHNLAQVKPPVTYGKLAYYRHDTEGFLFQGNVWIKLVKKGTIEIKPMYHALPQISSQMHWNSWARPNRMANTYAHQSLGLSCVPPKHKRAPGCAGTPTKQFSYKIYSYDALPSLKELCYYYHMFLQKSGTYLKIIIHSIPLNFSFAWQRYL